MASKSFGVAVTVATNAVGELTDASISGGDVSFIDITNHGSSGGYREFVSGLKDGGTLELAGNYDVSDTGQAYIANNEGAEAAVVVTFADTSTASFSTIIGAYDVTNPLDDKISFSASLKITGEITWA